MPSVRRHLTRAAITERVELSLHAAALWDEVKDKLQESGLALSGGQQQLVGVARAVIANQIAGNQKKSASAGDGGPAGEGRDGRAEGPAELA